MKKLKITLIITIVLSVIGISFMLITRNNVTDEKIGACCTEILSQCLVGKFTTQNEIEFKESWNFTRAKIIKVYTDCQISSNDPRVFILPLSEYGNIKVMNPHLYDDQTLIVAIKPFTNNMDGIEFSYAWGPLAAHGIQILITGNSAIGFNISTKHAWIS